VKPGTELSQVERSLKIILDDIGLRKEEARMNLKREGKDGLKKVDR